MNFRVLPRKWARYAGLHQAGIVTCLVFGTLFWQGALADASSMLTAVSVNSRRGKIQARLSESVSSTVHHRIHDGHLQVIWDLEGADMSSMMRESSSWVTALKRQWPGLSSVSVSRFSGPVLRLRFEFSSAQYHSPVVMGYDTNQPYLALQSTQATIGGGEIASPVGESAVNLVMSKSARSASSTPSSFSDNLAAIQTEAGLPQPYRTFQRPEQRQSQIASSAKSRAPSFASVMPDNRPEPHSASSAVMRSSSSDGLQRQVNELNQKIAYWQEKYQTLARNSQHTAQEKDCFKLGLQMSKTHDELAALRKRNEVMSADMERLLSERAELAHEHSSAITAVAIASEEPAIQESKKIEKMKAMLNQSKQSLLKSIQTINRQNQAIARLNEQLTDVQEGIGQASLEQQTYLNDQLTKAEAHQKTLEKSVQRLELANRSLKLVVNGLQKKLPEGAMEDILSQGGLPDLPEDEASWVMFHVEEPTRTQSLEQSMRLKGNEAPAAYEAMPSS